MNTVTCCLSGIGTSAAAARKIAAAPGNPDLVPIASPGTEPGRTRPAADRGRYRHPGLTAGNREARRGIKA